MPVVASLLKQINMISGAEHVTSDMGNAFCSISIEKGKSQIILSHLEETTVYIYGLSSQCHEPSYSKKTTPSGWSVEHHMHLYIEDIMSPETEVASSLEALIIHVQSRVQR